MQPVNWCTASTAGLDAISFATTDARCVRFTADTVYGGQSAGLALLGFMAMRRKASQSR